MKTKMKKALLLSLCAVLLVVASVAGTYAYLTDTAEEVKNTFTVGNVTLEGETAGVGLDETIVDEYGKAKTGTDAGRTNSEQKYTLIPGHEYTKDPTIYVKQGSEASYVFVKVVNEISDIEDSSNTIANQITTTNGWTALGGVSNVFWKKCDKAETMITLPVFGTLKISSTKTASDLASYQDKTIKVTAYAIQSDGIDSADDAWTKGGFN